MQSQVKTSAEVSPSITRRFNMLLSADLTYQPTIDVSAVSVHRPKSAGYVYIARPIIGTMYDRSGSITAPESNLRPHLTPTERSGLD